MTKRSRTTWIALTLAGVVSMAGCDLRLEKSADDQAAADAPVAVAQTTDAPLSPDGPAEPDDLTGAGASATDPSTSPSPSASPTATAEPTEEPDQPDPKPTVAK